jgi:hypothetical protein
MPRKTRHTESTVLSFHDANKHDAILVTAVRLHDLRNMVKLGIANTRMKDFYDLKTLSELVAFESQPFAQAVHRTFEVQKNTVAHRNTSDRFYRRILRR